MATRIAVIGFGAAGIVAVRVLKQFSPNSEIVAFEKTSSVGGIWIYQNKTNQPSAQAGPMYKSLRTNLPYHVMPYPDCPIPQPKDGSVFLRHEEVAEYLQNYSQQYNLLPHVRFNTAVTHLKRCEESNRWIVTSQKPGTEPETVEMFDFVVICSGHYSSGIVPKIEGIHQFRGEVMHSVDYDTPNKFQNKCVILLGAAASGQDICLDISPFASEMYLSHNSKLNSQLPTNVHQVASIVRCLDERSFELSDGEIVSDVDVLIYCTGYRYEFPYLDANCDLLIEDGYMAPLYYQVVNALHPTMFFIGMCRQVCPFPNFYIQARYIAKIVENKETLPNKEELLFQLEEEKRAHLASGKPMKHLFVIENAQWDYNRKLAQCAGCEAVPLAIEKLYQEIRHIRRTRLTEYRQVKVVQEENGDNFSIFI